MTLKQMASVHHLEKEKKMFNLKIRANSSLWQKDS